MNDTSRTDWARIDTMSDEEIDTSDISPLSDDFFDKAQLRIPKLSTKSTVIVETLARFPVEGDNATGASNL